MREHPIVENSRPGLNRQSPFAPPTEEPPKPGAWVSILLAAVVGLIVVTGLFVLMLQIGGPLAIACVLVLGIGGVIAAFHYLLWGHWLGRTIREEVEAEERQRAAKGESKPR
jgi:hypothetical protein